MLESGSINVLPWITDRMDLQQVPETFSTLFDRPRLIKAIVDVAQPGC
jgi:threonine dehydrogenase-like Zn-dependent dehydrogenase